jgi:DNA repair photolyase
MDFAPYLQQLLGGLWIGDEVFPRGKLTEVSCELGLQLTVVFDDLAEVHVEIEPFSTNRPYAARTAQLLFSYRLARKSLNRQHDQDAKRAHALCVSLAERCAPQEQLVLQTIAKTAAKTAAQYEGSTRIREVQVNKLLQIAGTPTERFYTLSPYVGCLIGCKFCYAQSRLSTLRLLEKLPEIPWGSYVDVRTNAAEILTQELHSLTAYPIKFCPIVSDPYQAVETRYELTRKCLQVLQTTVPARTVLILTRSKLIERDAELLASLPKAYAGASIPTADDQVRKHFEPRGAPIQDRLQALRTLRQAGVRTFAVVQPMLPGSVEALADALADTVSSVRIDVLYSLEKAEDDFLDERYAHAGNEQWQTQRALQLSEALIQRGVHLWPGELPTSE